MTDFGTTPVSDTTLAANTFPVSAVFVPGTAGGKLTALQGGTASTDVNGFTSAPAALSVADGSDVTQGTSTDANTVNTVMGRLTKIRDLLNGTLPVSGTFWQATQPVSAATLPLPAGASTSAKQPALGTAGTASSDVLTVQGIASMTALKVDGSGVTQPVSGTVTANAGTNLNTSALVLDTSVNGILLAQASTTSGQKGPLMQGAVTTSAPTYTTAQTNPLSLTTAGLLRVDGSGVTQPVSGTITANQGGTWTVQPGNTANTTAWKVDGSAVTQPVSAASLPLPTGASTSAKQPALGTAGSASADVLTVQGIASMTALKVDGSGVTQPVSGTITANAGTNLNTSALALDATVAKLTIAQATALGSTTGPMVQGSVTTNAPSYTTGDINPLSLDTSGLLRMSLKDTPANTNAFKVDGSAVTQPVSGTFWQATQPVSGTVSITADSSVNVAQVAGTTTDTNSGVKSAGTLRVVLATDQPALTNKLLVTPDSVALPANQSVNVAQFGGTNTVTGTGAGGAGVPRVTVSNDTQLQIWDGTTGPVAVEPANERPDLSDKALVTAISPNNSGLPVNIPVIVQKTNAASSGSVASLALAFAGNTIAGNSIVVVCAVGNGTAPTITDSASNTYTQAAQIANSTTLNVAVFYAVNIAAGANTVTVNNGGTTASIAMEIYEVSGLIAQVQAQPDQTATNTGTSGTASTSAISPLAVNELAFASVGIGTAAQTITAGSGWTNDSGQQNPTTPAGLFSFISMSQFLGSLKAVTPQATFTSEPWGIAVATFKPVLLGVSGQVTLAAGSATIGSLAANQSVNVAQINGVTPLMGNGTTGAGSQRVTIASDNTAFSVNAVESGTWTVQPGNTQNTTAWLTAPQATTTGGSTPYHLMSAASTNATSVKGSAGNLYGLSISNANAAARYFKLYDKASAPTVGTDVPKRTVQVPANGTVITAFPVGLSFANGIAFSTNTGIADTDNTGVGANDLSIDLDYK